MSDETTVAAASIASVPMPSSPWPVAALTSAASVSGAVPLLIVTPGPTVTFPVAASEMDPLWLDTLPSAVNGALAPVAARLIEPAVLLSVAPALTMTSPLTDAVSEAEEAKLVVPSKARPGVDAPDDEWVRVMLKLFGIRRRPTVAEDHAVAARAAGIGDAHAAGERDQARGRDRQRIGAVAGDIDIVGSAPGARRPQRKGIRRARADNGHAARPCLVPDSGFLRGR